LPPADHLLIERRDRGQFVPSRPRRTMANVRAERLLKIPAEPSPELRIPGAPAQTRMVSVAEIRRGSGKSTRAFKGIICDDISEFESHMPPGSRVSVGNAYSRKNMSETPDPRQPDGRRERVVGRAWAARLLLRIPNAAAQTRIVSKARIRLDSCKSVRSFKGIISDDISEFESHMPSQAVGSPSATM
jgi:hypothetical protein